MSKIQPSPRVGTHWCKRRKEKQVLLKQAEKGSQLAIRLLKQYHGIKFKREVEPKGGRSG